jgi:hypothetical protein
MATAAKTLMDGSTGTMGIPYGRAPEPVMNGTWFAPP